MISYRKETKPISLTTFDSDRNQGTVVDLGVRDMQVEWIGTDTFHYRSGCTSPTLEYEDQVPTVKVRGKTYRVRELQSRELLIYQHAWGTVSLPFGTFDICPHCKKPLND